MEIRRWVDSYWAEGRSLASRRKIIKLLLVGSREVPSE